MINVCVPVLKRYDLLGHLLSSLEGGTVQPDAVYIVDNGRSAQGIASLPIASFPVFVRTPDAPMGVAASWNWFIQNVPETRVISNDDVTFEPGSLEKLVGCDADLVWAEGFGFSCFLIRDACVQKIGLFDETISPGYAYYEDEDYLQRLDGRGTREASARAVNVDCGILHAHSATLKVASPFEMMEHHRKFKIARANYMKKWGVTDEEMFGVKVGAR